MDNIYIAAGYRTAIGSFGGSLKDICAVDLGAACLAYASKRAGITPGKIDEVIFGNVLGAGLGQNISRQIALKAGLPTTIPATTINMVCGSGMKAIVEGARAILAGDGNIFAVGGAENMSQAPYLVPEARFGAKINHITMIDSLIKDGLWDAFNDCHMGMTAENISEKWQISREEQDIFALNSQEKAKIALAENKFADEIIPIEITIKKEKKSFCVDEYVRDTNLSALAKLKTAFKQDGSVTAGNSSGINDGAAALILVSETAVRENNIIPMAKIIGWGHAGVDPTFMGMGPVEAINKALLHAGLTRQQIGLVELNEAFAVQSLAVMRELALPPDIVNVNGGAIALGHPIGASGARIVVTLIHEMKKRKIRYGLASLCIGGGMGMALVVDNI